jgi:hypothetical protein
VNTPPPTKEGIILWHAANATKPNSQNENEKTSKPGNGPTKRGRKKGAKKWSTQEIDVLFNSLEESLPAGHDQWERVSLLCASIDATWCRTGDLCKNKFEKLAFQKKPTGTAEVPLHVLLAKNIKGLISSNEVIGYIGGNNDVEGDDDSNEDSIEGGEHDRSRNPSPLFLESAKLSDGNGNVRRPVMKKQKGGAMADAIHNLGVNQVKAAEKLQSAINGMAEALRNGAQAETSQVEMV